MTQEPLIQKPLFWIPLTLFIGLCILLAVGLTLNPTELPSPLIGKPAPAFTLPILGNTEQKFSNTDND